MDFEFTLLLVGLVIVAIIGAVSTTLAQRRDSAIHSNGRQAAALRVRIAEVSDVAASLAPLVGTETVVQMLDTYSTSLTDRLLQIDPSEVPETPDRTDFTHSVRTCQDQRELDRYLVAIRHGIRMIGVLVRGRSIDGTGANLAMNLLRTRAVVLQSDSLRLWSARSRLTDRIEALRHLYAARDLLTRSMHLDGSVAADLREVREEIRELEAGSESSVPEPASAEGVPEADLRHYHYDD